MTVETITNGIEDLDPNFPAGTDPVSEGDNHVRNTKTALGLSFPNTNGPWNTTSEIRANGFDAKTIKIRNVGAPTVNTDAARKGETDALEARIQLLEAQNARFQSFGIYDGVNEVIIGGTGDWTVTKEAVGVYRFVFNETAGGLYSQSVVANNYGVFNAGADAFYGAPVNANTWQIASYASNGQLTDTFFTFIRVAD